MYTHLKKRPPFPFETITTALAFSDRCEALIAEVKHYSELFKSKLVIIHVGEKTSEKQHLLDTYCKNVGLAQSAFKMVWLNGEPVETVLQACKDNAADLLILGAMEKETLYRFYIGSVARKISRKAKCSVLLLTSPNKKPKSFKRIVVNHNDSPKTDNTINTAMYWAHQQNDMEVYLVNEVHLPTLSMTMADSSAPEASKLKQGLIEEEKEDLEEMCKKYADDNIKVCSKTVTGKTGYAISNFAKVKKANLLVLNSPDKQLGFFDRIFTHDIEHVLADLPCNLLIVHSRI